jgi:hypothetical protein
MVYLVCNWSIATIRANAFLKLAQMKAHEVTRNFDNRFGVVHGFNYNNRWNRGAHQ